MKRLGRDSAVAFLRVGSSAGSTSAQLDRSAPSSLVQLCGRLDDLSNFTDNNLAVYKDLGTFLRKKLAAEEEAARGTCKLAKSMLEQARVATETGNPLAANWQELLLCVDSHLQKEADALQKTSNHIPDNFKDLDQTRKTLKSDMDKIVKALKNVYVADQKARTKYVTTSNELTMLSAQTGDAKLADKVEQMRKKVSQTEKDMRESTAAVNQAQETYYSHEIPALKQKYRELNEQVGVYIEGLFRSFFALLVESLPTQQAHQSDVSVVAASSDYLKAMIQLDAIRDSDAFNAPAAVTPLDMSDAVQVANFLSGNNDDSGVGGGGSGNLLNAINNSSSTAGGGSSGGAPSDGDQEVLFSGWLTKQGDSVKSWKRRWCVLSTDFTLSYYERKEDTTPKGKIILPSYTINTTNDVKQPFAFKATHNNVRTYYFAADSEDDMRKWIAHLTAASQLQKLGNVDPEASIIRSYPAPAVSTRPRPSTPVGASSASEKPVQVATAAAAIASTSSSAVASPRALPKAAVIANANAANAASPTPPRSPIEESLEATASSSPTPMPRAKPKPSEKRVVAKYECEPSLPDELAFKEGEVLVIVEEVDSSWWRARNANGQIGLIPSNYVQ